MILQRPFYNPVNIHDGEYIKGVFRDPDTTETRLKEGVVILSLGILLALDGTYEVLTRLDSCEILRYATNEEVLQLVDIFNENKDSFVVFDAIEIAKPYMDTTDPREILPLQYNMFSLQKDIEEYLISKTSL